MTSLPKPVSVWQEPIDLPSSIEEFSARFSHQEGCVLLLSGAEMDCARYHMLGLRPWLTLKGRAGRLALTCPDKTQTLEADPFDVLDRLMAHFSIAAPDTEFPLQAGLMGYFSYDLKDNIEDLPRTCLDTGLPDICLYAPSAILIQEKATGDTRLFVPILENSPAGLAPETYVRRLKQALFEPAPPPPDHSGFSVDPRGLVSCFTKDEYVRAVEKIIQYLRAGDIYQANLSQRFETGFSGNAFTLFRELFQQNPAPFFSFINAGDHQIVSTSPERFIQLSGTRVETRPIKGTIARGTTAEEDKERGGRLCASIKDDAELTMIVDLMRNDLSRVTDHGSVVVAEHKRLEPYDNVFHLVSVVRGELSAGKTPVDLLRATFPGGSITGCPKIRSMEIIDELEPVKRHVYTGSIGYLSFHDTMDLSIAIRTATVRDKRIYLSVGGGIVYDSDPEKEFQETLDKGKTLMETLDRFSGSTPDRSSGPGAEDRAPLPPKAWINGKIVDQDRSAAPADSLGFQYGAGLFETIRVEKGRPLHLPAHVDRMNRSWQALFGTDPPDITWEPVVSLLIRENGLGNTTAAVKLMIARGRTGAGSPAFPAGFARPYVHRLALLGKSGLDLITYPHARQTPLASHKTMNYLFYDRAGQYAGAAGGDEALILNPDGSISETNTCNIILKQGDQVVVPKSAHALPGIALETVKTGLAGQGIDVVEKRIFPADLAGCSDIILTNSLVGAVPAASVDGKRIGHAPGFCDRVNAIIN